MTRRSRISDIAEAAGVSIASVSKALNNRSGVGNESRERILEAAARLDYKHKTADVADAFPSGVAVVTTAALYLNSQFYEGVIQGALDAAKEAGVPAKVHLMTPDIETGSVNVERLVADDGACLLLVGLDHPVLIEQVVRSHAPAVILNGIDRTMRLSCVLPDNRSAGWLATTRLLSEGHTEIVHVSRLFRTSLKERFDGFRDAMQEAGIAIDPDRHLFDLMAAGVLEPGMVNALTDAMQKGRYAKATAFVCSNDIMALGVIDALRARGSSIPRDYSVIGMDDISIAQHSNPALTTLRIEREELGRVGWEMLRERALNSQARVRRIGMAVRIIERGTVGPPRDYLRSQK
jgi:DNA-binding LacI/PurR family transcriptional regulator